MGASRNSDHHVSTLSRTQEMILAYLESNVEKREYLKSKQIAKDIDGLSAKEIGTNMPALQRGTNKFSIEKWGYSTGTTWMVERINN